MKRQFKAGVMAKHEVKRLKKVIETKNENIINYAKQQTEYDLKLHNLRNANIEQKAELWKVKKANTQLENEIEKVKKSLETHKEILRIKQNKDHNTIQDLTIENKELKKRVILFAGALLAMCFVAMWGL
jgi:predicted RNase H-like nuclease (RuvC/YqgF family)